MRIDPPINNYF